MSHALSITSSRTLLVLLSSTLALACNKDEPKPTAATVDPAGTPAGTPATPVAPVVAAAPELVHMGSGEVALAGGDTIPGLDAEPDVLGHFALVNASQLITDVKTQLVPPKYAGFLEEATLRSMLSIALEKRGNLAMNYDLAAPLGCALVEPSIDDLKMSCVFGYKGGASAFAGDLGDENRRADAEGHTAAYGLAGKVAYIDALGERVVVSSGADTFKKTQNYLQRNILDRAGKIHGDLEVVVYMSTIFERYRSQLEPLLKLMNSAPPPATGNPAVDGAMAAFSSYSQRNTLSTIERIAEMSQISMFISVEPEGVAMGGALFAKPGSRMAQELAVYGAPRLDPAFVGTAPSGTAMLFAMNMTPQAEATPSVAETRKMLAEVWGSFTGLAPAAIESALATLQRENAALYEGHTMVALSREPGALFGLEVAARLQSGKSARDAWKAWSTAFTPEAALGAEYSQYLTWSFKPDAATVEGVAIDRWTIAPGVAAKAVMEQNMKPEARDFIDKALGGLYLNIDRAETEGSVIFTVAPKAEANFMKRAIAAAQGKGGVAGAPGLARVMGRDPQTSGVLAVDVRQGIEWIRDLKQFGARTENLPQNLGTDLGDVYFTVRYAGDGAMAMEYMFSQQMITQIRAIIPG